MWRSFFIALGIMAIIVGLESLVIHSANFYSTRGSTAGEFMDPSTVSGQSIVTWKPQRMVSVAGTECRVLDRDLLIHASTAISLGRWLSGRFDAIRSQLPLMVFTQPL